MRVGGLCFRVSGLYFRVGGLCFFESAYFVFRVRVGVLCLRIGGLFFRVSVLCFSRSSGRTLFFGSADFLLEPAAADFVFESVDFVFRVSGLC